MTVVGFDFGTTNSLISVVVGDRVIDVVDPDDGLPFPSVVRYEGSKTLVGREAKESLDSIGVGVHGNTVMSPKFLLGDQSVHVGGVERSPIDIVHDVVSHVKSEALRSPRASALEGVTQAVVTIPVNMTGPRRAALRDAFRRSDIGITQFVHEPLAALYGYFRSAPDMAAMQRQYNRRYLLVVDWGGGTLDLTLCRLDGGRITQIRNHGTDEVGGDRFDEAIRNGVIERFTKETGVGVDSDVHPDARTRLLHDAEMNKIALSTRSAVTFYRQGFFRDPDATLEYRLTREVMEEVTSDLVRTGVSGITHLLDGAGIGPSQIALCLVTGGMASMPIIRSRLNELFGPQRVEVPDNSATLIAQGAAWVAHDRQRLRLARTIEVELARSSYLPVLPADTEMPIEREVKRQTFHLYCVDPRDGTAKFQLCTPRRTGGHAQASDARDLLGTIVVDVDSKARPFREHLELELRVDDDMILHAAASSSDVGDRSETEFHDLEFGISLPGADTGEGSRLPFDEGSESQERRGELVVRSNLAKTTDNALVPGDLLHSYLPSYFRRDARPPQIQIEEWLYYQPCAVCGRRSSDLECKCASAAS
jgi:molecular chaperone DnaK (HSP70)